MATGVGQAAPESLVRIAIAAAAAAAAIVAFWPEFWVGATPLVCLSCFGTYGILAQRTYLLDLAHEKRSRFRRGLYVARVMAVCLGAASGLAGLIGVTVLLTQRGARL